MNDVITTKPPVKDVRIAIFEKIFENLTEFDRDLLVSFAADLAKEWPRHTRPSFKLVRGGKA